MENREIWNLSALCRCCHVDGNFKSLAESHLNGEETELYSEMLRDTFNIELKKTILDASYTICDDCITKLRDATLFRKQVLMCEQKFEEYCNNEVESNNVNIKIKVEIGNDSYDKEYEMEEWTSDTNTKCDDNAQSDCNEKSVTEITANPKIRRKGLKHSKMNVKKMIEKVKKHVFLYDISHPEYKNTDLKAAAWEMIAKELNQNVLEVKLKWKTIKDGYMKYKRQIKDSTESGKVITDYIWKSQLMFLDSYNVTRKTQRGSIQPKTLNYYKDLLEKQDCTASPSSCTEDKPLSGLLLNNPSTSTLLNDIKRKKCCDVDKVLLYLNKKSENVDAADHLFKSYAVTFKKFNCRQQAHIKIEMAKLFANTELGLLYNVQPPLIT